MELLIHGPGDRRGRSYFKVFRREHSCTVWMVFHPHIQCLFWWDDTSLWTYCEYFPLIGIQIDDLERGVDMEMVNELCSVSRGNAATTAEINSPRDVASTWHLCLSAKSGDETSSV